MNKVTALVLEEARKSKKNRIKLEKLCWAIKQAEAKRGKLQRRLAKITRDIEDGGIYLFNLSRQVRMTVADLDVAGWDPVAWQARTGLKLPE